MSKVSSLALRRSAIIVLIGEYLSLRVQHNLVVFSLVVVHGYIDNSPQQSARPQTNHATAHSKQCDIFDYKMHRNVLCKMCGQALHVCKYKNVLMRRKFTQIVYVLQIVTTLCLHRHTHTKLRQVGTIVMWKSFLYGCFSTD